MAIQQGTGYRDPAKTMTIKALQERQKAAQLATAKAAEMPQQISDPWQAAAHVMGVAGSRFADLSAGRQETAARERLAGVMAGIDPEKGASMAQIAEMQQLDPDFANKEYERMMAERAAVRNREDEQTFRTGERVGGQEFTAGESEKTRQATADQNELNRQADIARQKMQEAAADNRQDDAQLASQELARLNAQIDETKAKTDQTIKEEAIPAEAKIRQDEWLKLNPGGDTNSPEAQSYILRNAAAPTGGFGGPAGLKAMQDFQHEGNIYTTGLNDINEAKALVPNALTGEVGRKIADWASSLGEGGIDAAVAASNSGIVGMLPDFFKELKGITREQIQSTVRMYAIMDKVATIQLGGTLKGQSSNMEMDKFLKIFANPSATPEMKMQALQSMEQAFITDRQNISDTIQTAGGQALTPYEYKPIESAMPAPADTGGGGGGGNAAVPTITGDDDPVYQALPPDAPFIGPDGKKYKK